MICRIQGTLVSVQNEQAVIEIGPLQHLVMIPDFVRRRLQSSIGDIVTLHTIEYLEGNPAQGRLTPRMVGFQHEAERAFFESFCSVDGVGAKKALRAMVRPVQDIAVDIEQKDSKSLATLPGIGPATADRIVAKLSRKMSRFALIVTPDVDDAVVDRDVVKDTFEALLVLGHSETEARRLIDGALATKKRVKDVEGMLQAIYENRAEA
ncbi:MAG: Holliday junction branch migration protein RuvA [Pirellulaceae bacterium]